MTTFEVVRGDITIAPVDVIVNAANRALVPGGGVDGAIHRAGGPSIARETSDWVRRHGPLTTGGAMTTDAGDLPARHVAHTVGPVWGAQPDDESDRLLASCYVSSLDAASKLGCRSMAFPNISTGAYGFPAPRAASIATGTVATWIEAHPDVIGLVLFVCFEETNARLYESLLG